MHPSGGLRRSVFSPSSGRWVRPWPGAPRCWPRLRSERGFVCRSLLRPNSDFDSTVRLARSFASWASSVSTCDASAVLPASEARASARSRAFFSRSDTIMSVARTIAARSRSFRSRSQAIVRSRASTVRRTAACRRSNCLRSDAISSLRLSADRPSASRSQAMSFFSQSISSRCWASIRSLWSWDLRSDSEDRRPRRPGT